MRYKITVHKLNITVWSSLHKQRKKFYYVYSAWNNNKLLFYTTCYHYTKKKISAKFINDLKDALSDLQFVGSITVNEITNTPAIKEYDV